MLIQHINLSIYSKKWHIVTLTVTFIHYIAVLCFAGDISFGESNKTVVDPGIELVTFRSHYVPWTHLFSLINTYLSLQEISYQVPAPDLSHLIKNLEYFRRNTFKSLPYTRWGSSRDAFCYRRVKTHVDSFKVGIQLGKYGLSVIILEKADFGSTNVLCLPPLPWLVVLRCFRHFSHIATWKQEMTSLWN